MSRYNLCSLVDRSEDRLGERPFLVDHRVISYREAAIGIRRLAAWLLRSGVRRGDRVMIITANRPEVALAAFAAARIGAIFTVLHNSIRGYGLKKIVEQVEPALAVLDETTAHLAAEVGTPRILGVDGTVSSGIETIDQVLHARTEEFEGFGGIDLDPVCLLYTSGSTGVPRGVTLTHDNILFVVGAIQARLGYRADDTIGVFLPLSFDYAVRQDLRRGAECSCARTAATCRELLAGEKHLWTFLRVPGVDPTNSAAERAAARGALAQDQRRDGERRGESVRGADAVGGSDLPAAGPERVGVPHRLP